MRHRPEKLVAKAWRALLAVRSRQPRVHCLTNQAATVLTANALLALGAVPSLTSAPDEVAAFVSSADALLVNLGTLDAERVRSIDIAVEIAREDKTPFVLDPVFIDRSPSRAVRARKLVQQRPSVLKCNRAEVAALLGAEPTANALASFALERLETLALTGADDVVTNGADMVTISNGHPLATRVTAMGCALGALVAAFCAVEDEPFVAAFAALLTAGIAGEVAAEKSQGPGTFQPAFLDALANLDEATVHTRARLS